MGASPMRSVRYNASAFAAEPENLSVRGPDVREIALSARASRHAMRADRSLFQELIPRIQPESAHCRHLGFDGRIGLKSNCGAVDAYES